MNVAEVLQALLALNRHDRAAVIRRGLASLDADEVNPDQGEVDAAWRSELRRRINDIYSGKVKLLNAGAVHAQIRVELAAMRT